MNEENINSTMTFKKKKKNFNILLCLLHNETVIKKINTNDIKLVNSIGKTCFFS